MRVNNPRLVNKAAGKGSQSDIAPDAYKKGWIEFYKLRFKVTPDVLIPRPETELLVDESLQSIKDYESSTNYHKSNPAIVLDIGTGSGNIAVSIAKNTPQVKIIATDISQKALHIAKLNAKLHKMEDRITFISSHLLTNPQLSTLIPNSSCLIVTTNLPYIPSARIPYLDSSVKDFEPRIALDGGEDGFDLYRKLFAQIKEMGWNPKLIVGEIDYTQADTAYTEAKKYFPEAQTKVKLDLAHKQRVLTILNPQA